MFMTASLDVVFISRQARRKKNRTEFNCKLYDLIAELAHKWHMAVSVSKCNVLIVGNSSLVASYELDGCKLASNSECRDLGITVASNLSPASHIIDIIAKAHQRANIVLRCFISGDINVTSRGFHCLCAPHSRAQFCCLVAMSEARC